MIAVLLTLILACPLTGDAKTEKLKALDALKNREVTEYNGHRGILVGGVLIVGDSLLPPYVNLWTRGPSALNVSCATRESTVVGWVVKVKRGGPETANCGSKNVADHDWHIMVAPKKSDPPAKAIVCEITPHVRPSVKGMVGIGGVAMMLDGSRTSDDALAMVAAYEPGKWPQVLLHHRVRITGLPLYDFVHENVSADHAKKGTRIERATAWELHPITRIEVLR